MGQFVNMHYARPINFPIPSQPLAVYQHGTDLFCAKLGEDHFNSLGGILKSKGTNLLIVALMVPETYEPNQQWPYFSATVSDVQMLLGM